MTGRMLGSRALLPHPSIAKSHDREIASSSLKKWIEERGWIEPVLCFGPREGGGGVFAVESLDAS